MNVHLAIIDPQLDFCWPGLAALGVDLNSPEWKVIEPILRTAIGPLLDDLVNPGKLYVPGAYEDMQRVAKMIEDKADKIADIHITLDSHQIVDQAHPIWWKRASDGSRPSPFTILDVIGDKIMDLVPQADGSLQPGTDEYTTRFPSMMHKGGVTGDGSLGYLKALNDRGRFKHVVWPVHCEIGSFGHGIVPQLLEAVRTWQDRFAVVNFVTKGSNIHTEHYGAVEAEVPDPSDDSTQVNTDLTDPFVEADMIGWAGEANTHCLITTFRGVAANFPDPSHLRKCVVLTDACSPVPGFEAQWDQFVQEFKPKGVQFMTTADFLA